MGTLYVVGTPIGNLEDVTQRALRTMREVTVIAAEDTRQTRKLLHHFDIHTPMVSYHEHNQHVAGPALVERLLTGDDVALVTDAGMPAISDPGEGLVKLAIVAGVRVVPIPGPTAFATALVVSGLKTDQFVFVGFLSAKRKVRLGSLQSLRDETRTWILYEAPHRLEDLLTDLHEVLGNRPMVVARELTKLHEEVLRGTAEELLSHFRNTPPRGEIVLVISGAPAVVQPMVEATPDMLVAAVSALEAEGLDRKSAMKEVAVRFGISRRDVYQAVIDQKDQE